MTGQTPRTRPAAPGPGGGRPLTAVKIIVAGGPGAGKTAFTGSVPDIQALTAEGNLTEASTAADGISLPPGKATTTAATDFGRIILGTGIMLYVSGTPGQHRFWYMRDKTTCGATGAVILACTRRLAGSFPAADYFETAAIPFTVAASGSGGTRSRQPADVSESARPPCPVRRPRPRLSQGNPGPPRRARHDPAAREHLKCPARKPAVRAAAANRPQPGKGTQHGP